METVVKKKLYEGMFLVDSALAGSDWDGVMAAIKRILDRADAEIVSIRKWDDRRLAYDIKHVSRGTYILTYFRTDGKNIQDVEKDVQLSEKILRVLILTADHMTAEDIEKDTPATKAEKEERKPIPAKESGEESEEEPQDDQQADEDTEEELKESETTEESETEEDAEDVEEADEAEQTEEEEQPKTPADD